MSGISAVPKTRNQLLANLVWGYVADKLTPRRCMIGTMLGAAGTVLLLVGVDSLFSAYVFGILWGIVSSSQVLIYMILAHYFGQASYGTIAGSLRPFEAGGLGVGQSLGAVLYEMTGSYSGLMVASFGALLLAALLMFLARPPAAPVVLKNSGRIPHRCG
jgi:MFS family permease